MTKPYFKTFINLILIGLFLAGCTTMGKKGTKGFKHDTPLIKTDVKKLGKAELDKTASQNISWLLVRQHLIDKEKVESEASDVDNKIKELIEQSPNYKKEIKKFYDDEQNKNKLRDDLLNQKFFEKMEQYFINKSKDISTDKIRNKKG